MSNLLLDDVGLCLLRQLSEAWQASEEYALSCDHHDYMVTSYNDLWRLSFEYNALVEDYVIHLRFCYYSRLYWPRLTVKLWCDANMGDALLEWMKTDDIADLNYIAKKSVQAYQRAYN
jgi:hypothetical protein